MLSLLEARFDAPVEISPISLSWGQNIFQVRTDNLGLMPVPCGFDYLFSSQVLLFPLAMG